MDSDFCLSHPNGVLMVADRVGGICFQARIPLSSGSLADGDLSLMLAIIRQVYGGHATAPDLTLNFVAVAEGARQRFHRAKRSDESPGGKSGAGNPNYCD